MTRQQQMAMLAYKAADRVVRSGDKTEPQYRTHALSTPAMLLRNGLVQTVAFLHTRGTDGASWYLADLARTSLRFDAAAGDTAAADLLYAAARGESTDANDFMNYIATTADVLAASEWLRRMAQSHLTGGDQS